MGLDGEKVFSPGNVAPEKLEEAGYLLNSVGTCLRSGLPHWLKEAGWLPWYKAFGICNGNGDPCNFVL